MLEWEEPFTVPISGGWLEEPVSHQLTGSSPCNDLF
jgi:hypothetical protein